jgi:hypothetical protein
MRVLVVVMIVDSVVLQRRVGAERIADAAAVRVGHV